jgi:two-component system chemotaxis sensor kinase CheA
VTLTLEDLYARVAQEEMPVSEALLNLTRAFIDQLCGVIELTCAGKTPEDAGLAVLLDQIKELLHLHADGRVFQIARDVLGLLNLPPEFEEAMTRENLLEVSQALRTGERFYTVLADLNQYEEVGQSFYEWSQSDAVRLITNVTVFRDDHTLFDFLVATFAPSEVLLADLARMDPQGQCLSLEERVLREGVKPGGMARDEVVRSTARRVKCAVDGEGDVSTEALASILENVGELVATRATLHRVTERLTRQDLVETVTRLVKRSDGDWQRVQAELQAALGSWGDDLSTLARAETEMGVALDRFREAALALRARPAAEILDPLWRLAQDVAQYLGKVVDLEVDGADVELDRGALDVLADPVRRLVWFAVAHGIEKPVERWETGKPAAGHVSITVRKAADHAYVVIEDDGRGIDAAATLKRARRLGWTNGDHVPAGKLCEWVLRDGFGLVGGSHDVEGIDLAAINAGLQAHRGRLDVSTEPGQGTRFSLDVLLDSVVIDGMVVRVGEVYYVTPIEAVRRIVKPEEGQIVRASADGGQSMLRLEDELLPIQTLSGQARTPMAEGLLLVVETGEGGYALLVDELVGQQQVLTQPLSGHLAEVEFISGCALLGEGDVGMVLDLSRVNVRG